MTDDLDGSAADETISFAWRGQAYDIDLNRQHAQEFADALAPYLTAARTSGRAAARGRRRGSALEAGATSGAVATAGVGDFDPKAVRAWARDNGVQISAHAGSAAGSCSSTGTRTHQGDPPPAVVPGDRTWASRLMALHSVRRAVLLAAPRSCRR